MTKATTDITSKIAELQTLSNTIETATRRQSEVRRELADMLAMPEHRERLSFFERSANLMREALDFAPARK